MLKISSLPRKALILFLVLWVLISIISIGLGGFLLEAAANLVGADVLISTLWASAAIAAALIVSGLVAVVMTTLGFLIAPIIFRNMAGTGKKSPRGGMEVL